MAGTCRGGTHGGVPEEAPPSGTALARKGGACGHSARRSCHPRGCGARPPIGAAAPTAKGAARRQGSNWMRAEGES
ncbi:hypothetical protein BHE74_00057538 [Ensete ventricosum]|nr:hypothetical protein GW17_00027401 [Ensete ventricosum]RWW37366.1 hypothetical protein BHE74_00057538 [Ensete ventricosum]RZS07286.1 hypothetical protein BHM03_00038103 [Ensete ventricosum]